MLFPTISFAVFFAVVLPLHWLTVRSRTWWRVVMVAASWFFYGCAGWGFVPLLIGSTVFNHAMGFTIDRHDGAARRWLARGAVVVNLGVLGYFKYIGFLSTSSTSLLDDLHLGVHLPIPGVVLPAGISFFTFQALSYVIDINRRNIRPVSLLDFAVYLSFFPHLLSGPIVRASEFLPQIRRRIDDRRIDAGRALWLIGQGIFKKVVISSYVSGVAVDPLFGFPHQHGGVEALFGIYAYAIEIYADFSGYTDIAIGLALLLGIRFPQNFDSPYTSRSLQEFWRRWHMTLSRWLRDYLYIPLGGNRRGTNRTYFNLMATMVLGGLWHGAAWTFVAWGGFHGAGLVVGRLRVAHRERDRQSTARAEAPELVAVGAHGTPGAGSGSGSGGMNGAVPVGPLSTGGLDRPSPVAARLRPVVGWFVTFQLVCLGWVFFRATSFSNATAVLARLPRRGTTPLDPVLVLVVCGAIATQFIPSAWTNRVIAGFSRWSILGQALALGALLVVIEVWGPPGVAPFIYFRF